MSNMTLRHYNTTLAYTSMDRTRRIHEFKKRFHARVNRRRMKQTIRQTLYHFNMT